MTHFRPTDEAELAAIVGEAIAREEPMELVAGGSKRGLGRPLQLPHTLDLAAFSGITAYEPEELVLTAGAATPLDEIEAALAEKRQMLAFEPGDWRELLGSETARPTLGGAVAANLSGPRRIRQGAARDHFLGFRGVSGRGEPFKAGGRVVKNVTGYDLPKLMAGSFGTLAALTEITLKVLPMPEATRTLVILGLDDEAARRAMSAALKSSHEVSGAAHLPAAGATARTCLRLEGPEPSVVARAAALRAELAEFGAIELLDNGASHALWQSVRDVLPLAAPGAAVWRVSVAPTAGPALAARIARAHDTRRFFDWGGGLVWLAVTGAEDGGAAAIRAALAGGHATLVRAPDALRAAVPPFEPQPEALAALTARVKAQFDPARILNRGRMYRDL
ncbi:MAG TPA: glycolate oxidase subunit GlcE [Stellaceae bacterium]|nr:glycolate oxidase subunit GlcE [Stellaceae bacterium]